MSSILVYAVSFFAFCFGCAQMFTNMFIGVFIVILSILTAFLKRMDI